MNKINDLFITKTEDLIHNNIYFAKFYDERKMDGEEWEKVYCGNGYYLAVYEDNNDEPQIFFDVYIKPIDLMNMVFARGGI